MTHYLYKVHLQGLLLCVLVQTKTPDIRKDIYTTNAIKSLNSIIRAAIKKR